MIATAPGKLILTGEYAVLDGAAALVIAIDRRAIARRDPQAAASAPPSPFLAAIVAELVTRLGADHPAVAAAREIVVDSAAFYQGVHKLGLGSSAAVTVAAAALALGANHRDLVLSVALAAHASAQGARGARGSGADIAAIVGGGAIEFRVARTADAAPTATPRRWPADVTLLPFFTGHGADTATLVARVVAARAANRAVVDAALTAIADASDDVCAACSTTALAAAANRAFATAPASELLAALTAAAAATDALAAATGVALVPACVTAAQRALARLGGVAKTTGAGGGDVAIAVLPATADAASAAAVLVECGCQPLALTVDTTGVDLRQVAR